MVVDVCCDAVAGLGNLGSGRQEGLRWQRLIFHRICADDNALKAVIPAAPVIRKSDVEAT